MSDLLPLRAANVLGEIAEERRRQIAVEGWSAEHDDKHIHGELAIVAALYGLPEHLRAAIRGVRQLFPATWDLSSWKPTTRRRDLVKAAALICAEIERLDREALRSKRRDDG